MSVLFTFNGLKVISTPADPSPSSFDFTLTDLVAANNNTFTGSQQIVDWQSSLISISVQLPPMQKEAGEDWAAFLMQCRGMSNAFLMGDAVNTIPRGSCATTGALPLVNGANQTGYTLHAKGYVAGAQGVHKRGDWIQLGCRLHKVLDDVDADANGKATIPIYPQIRESQADGSSIVTTYTKGLFRLASNTNKFSIGLAAIYGFQFDIREAF
jgi:hypothetical protein